MPTSILICDKWVFRWSGFKIMCNSKLATFIQMKCYIDINTRCPCMGDRVFSCTSVEKTYGRIDSESTFFAVSAFRFFPKSSSFVNLHESERKLAKYFKDKRIVNNNFVGSVSDKIHRILVSAETNSWESIKVSLNLTHRWPWPNNFC